MEELKKRKLERPVLEPESRAKSFLLFSLSVLLQLMDVSESALKASLSFHTHEFLSRERH